MGKVLCHPVYYQTLSLSFSSALLLDGLGAMYYVRSYYSRKSLLACTQLWWGILSQGEHFKCSHLEVPIVPDSSGSPDQECSTT